MRLSCLLWIGLLLSPIRACKKKNPETEGAAAQPTLQARPDKVSDVPTGLPGYPLVCRWTQGPASDTLEASLHCFLADQFGERAELDEKVAWEAIVEGDATLLQQMLANHSLNLTIKSSKRDALDLAIQTLQLSARYKTLQRASRGLDLVKAAPGKLRLAASCKNLLTLLFVNDAGVFSYLEINHFSGCEALSAGLLNTVLPDGKSRQLPDLHKDCSGELQGWFVSAQHQSKSLPGHEQSGSHRQ